ncbi:MAG TPA: RidA family protein [Thermoplasmata archaeon]|nr:RidA family protein [Thermoplasmata archaeon]
MPPSASEQLAKLGLTLPPPPKPAGSYVPAVQEGNLVWVSGQGAFRDGAVLYPGRVESKVSVEEAQEAARVATLQGLSAAAAVVGSVDRIRRVLRLGVFVASDPKFTRQHEVANGASELLIGLFGESGRPSRVSVGVPALPLNFPVEVEMVLAVW